MCSFSMKISVIYKFTKIVKYDILILRNILISVFFIERIAELVLILQFWSILIDNLHSSEELHEY